MITLPFESGDERWARKVLGDNKVDQLIKKWDREGFHPLDIQDKLWREASEHFV
jgi:hypothetical protein